MSQEVLKRIFLLWLSVRHKKNLKIHVLHLLTSRFKRWSHKRQSVQMFMPLLVSVAHFSYEHQSSLRYDTDFLWIYRSLPRRQLSGAITSLNFKCACCIWLARKFAENYYVNLLSFSPRLNKMEMCRTAKRNKCRGRTFTTGSSPVSIPILFLQLSVRCKPQIVYDAAVMNHRSVIFLVEDEKFIKAKTKRISS